MSERIRSEIATTDFGIGMKRAQPGDRSLPDRTGDAVFRGNAAVDMKDDHGASLVLISY
jgi:hypothetical protein